MSSARELIHVVGVRHHSPACARLVADTIARLRPSHVLIEGPSDMNGRLGELLLDHGPPIAIFSWLKDPVTARSRAVWSPFCAHSPEWVALREAKARGAQSHFMDLPAWHPAFDAIENRYADRRGDDERARADRWTARLAERFRLDDPDTLWDHLFELGVERGDEDAADLGARLALHFDALRGDEEAGPRDAPREAFMLRCLAWAALDAQAQGGTGEAGGVVAVCGGWHRPALLRRLDVAIEEGERDRGAAYPSAPLPAPPAGCAPAGLPEPQWGSYLVPYSHGRLDSLAGYAAGMPSPGFYDHVWREGPRGAAELALMGVARRLRSRGQPVSTADLVACRVAAEALARVRSHVSIARGDLLDAIASTLVKEALDVDVPWARRGPLRAGTDPLLVEVVRELTGDALGRLAPGTPRPPLASEVDATLAAWELTPTRVPRPVVLDLASARDRERSRALHRLRILGVPGFTWAPGSPRRFEELAQERWSIQRRVEADARLVEAAAYGATLESAARGALEERCAAPGGGATSLALALGDGILAGLLDLADAVLAQIEAALRREPSFEAVGAALRALLSVVIHGATSIEAAHPTLVRAVAAAFDRGLWLLEGLGGARGFPPREIDGVRALLEATRATEPSPLGVPIARARAVFDRCAADPAAAPAIRGACLGALVVMASTPAASGASASFDPGSVARALAAVRATPPRDLGDLLAGLFALAREPMSGDPDLVRAVDDLLGFATEGDFLAALPALRFAFSWFPPRERAAIAERVAALHGVPERAGSLLLEVAAPVDRIAAARIEAAASEVAARYGLFDARDVAGVEA